VPGRRSSALPGRARRRHLPAPFNPTPTWTRSPCSRSAATAISSTTPAAEITRLTARYVATTLADFASKFRGTAIEAIECRPGEVISRFQRGSRAERITWRVSNNKVTDVHVQNVWLGQVLRDNYAGVIQRGGGSIDALFFHLGARTTADTTR
jgi:hypothetical protein